MFAMDKNKVRVSGSCLCSACWDRAGMTHILPILLCLESSHCEMLLYLKKVWEWCMLGGGGRKKISLCFLRIFNCSTATPRRMRWQFKRVEKDDFITRDFQPESNFKYKTLGWFSPVTLQIHPPYSQFNPNCIKSIYLCSSFSSSSPKFIQHLRVTFLLNWLPLLPPYQPL